MLQQAPDIKAFTRAGIEAWPEGQPYQFEFLARINNLTVSPVPLPTSPVTLFSGLLVVYAAALRRRPRVYLSGRLM
jgi:hypothetical protein